MSNNSLGIWEGILDD